MRSVRACARVCFNLSPPSCLHGHSPTSPRVCAPSPGPHCVQVLSFTAQQPVVPPLGVTGVKLRGMHLFGVPFDFAYDAKTVCVQLQPGAAAGGLNLVLTGSAKVLTIPPASQPPLCVPLQPVEVAVPVMQ